MNITAIREALADQIKANVQATPNVYAYLPDAPQWPLIAVTPDDPFVSYAESMGPQPFCRLHLLVRIGATGLAEDAARFIDEMLAVGSATNSSVFDAIKIDQRLGGLVSNLDVGEARLVPGGPENAGYFEAMLPVTIYTRQD